MKTQEIPGYQKEERNKTRAQTLQVHGRFQPVTGPAQWGPGCQWPYRGGYATKSCKEWVISCIVILYTTDPTSVSSGQSPLRASPSLILSLPGQLSTRAIRWSTFVGYGRQRPNVEKNQSPKEMKWGYAWGGKLAQSEFQGPGEVRRASV